MKLTIESKQTVYNHIIKDEFRSFTVCLTSNIVPSVLFVCSMSFRERGNKTDVNVRI